MKMFKKAIVSSSFVYLASMTLFAEAALPPLYESLREYKELLNSTELASRLGSAEMIRDIKRDEKGFVITSQHHTLRVNVIYEPMGHPGPLKFHLEFENEEQSSH